VRMPWSRNGHVVEESGSEPTGREDQIVALRTAVGQLEDSLDLYQEQIAELELASEDVWWRRVGGVGGTHDFSRQYLSRIVRESRLYFLKNPLINRAVSVQAYYVFGQGVSITGRVPVVNDVIQDFLDDPANRTELTSHQARVGKEVQLEIEGNLFFVLFTNQTSGQVRIRTLPFDEVTDILTDPEDRKTVWYYKREWRRREVSLATGKESFTDEVTYYPDWQYRPETRQATIGGKTIQWDTPVYHVKVGGMPDMLFGVPEVYAALDWATAYKSWLEDWATIAKALSRFAWKATPKGGKRGVQATKAKLGTTVSEGANESIEKNPPPSTGSVAILPEGMDLSPIPKTDAVIHAKDGRELRLMVAAAVGLPDHFFGDSSVGNYATSRTLDRPTELKFLDRQTLWSSILVDVLSYVVDQSAMYGALSKIGARIGSDGHALLDIDPNTGEPMARDVDVAYPPILEHDILTTVNSIVNAITLGGKAPAGTIEPKLAVRLLLEALGVNNIDEILSTQFSEEPGSDGDGDGGAADDTGADGGTLPDVELPVDVTGPLAQ
jgi:hypothetical protein